MQEWASARVRAARAIMRRWRPRADFAEGLVAQLQELRLTALQLLDLVLGRLLGLQQLLRHGLLLLEKWCHRPVGLIHLRLGVAQCSALCAASISVSADLGMFQR